MPLDVGKAVSWPIRKMGKKLFQDHCFAQIKVRGLLQRGQAAETVVPAQRLEISSRFPQTAKGAFPALPFDGDGDLHPHLQEDFGEAQAHSSQALPKAAPTVARTLGNMITLPS